MITHILHRTMSRLASQSFIFSGYKGLRQSLVSTQVWPVQWVPANRGKMLQIVNIHCSTKLK